MPRALTSLRGDLAEIEGGTHRGLSRKLLRAKVRLYGDKHPLRGWGVPPKRSRHKGVLGQSLRHKGSGTRRRRENVCGIRFWGAAGGRIFGISGRGISDQSLRHKGSGTRRRRENVCGIRVLVRRRRENLWGISGRGTSNQCLRHKGPGSAPCPVDKLDLHCTKLVSM